MATVLKVSYKKIIFPILYLIFGKISLAVVVPGDPGAEPVPTQSLSLLEDFLHAGYVVFDGVVVES